MNSASITIVPARPEDAAGIGAVQHDTWIATYPNEEHGITLADIEEHVSSFESPERIAKWRSIIGNAEEYVMVAKDGPKVVGFSSAKRGEEADEVAAVYVLPKYQGTGVARRLMDAVMAWLGDGREVFVEVASYNDRAISFYKKYGFVATGEIGSSRGIPTIQMRRETASPRP